MEDPSSLYYFLGVSFGYVLFVIVRQSVLYFLSKEGFKKRGDAEVIPDRVFTGLFAVEIALILLAADGFSRTVVQFTPSVPAPAAFVIFTAAVLVLRGVARMLVPRSAAYLLGAFTAPVVRLVGYIVWPFVSVPGGLWRLLGLSNVTGRRPTAVAPDAEFFELYSAESGAELEEEEKEMIEAIISIRDTRAREIMVPRVDIVAVPETASIKEIKALLVKYGFSRLPVYRESVDNVVGILHAKDIFIAESTGADLKSLLKRPYYVPETKKVNEILNELQEHKTQMAVVVDEYGGTAGLITLEDVIEEIVGEIQDEYDAEELVIERLPDGSYRVNAKINLEELSEELGIEVPDEGFETLGGFIIGKEGYVPAPGEVFNYANLEVKILESDERRISRVQVLGKRPDEDAGD